MRGIMFGMGYVGSYLWKMRQKCGHNTIMSATTDVIPIRDGKVCMVLNREHRFWCFPGGHAELGLTWQEAARKELVEEAGLVAKDEDMKPFASVSGYTIVYGDNEPVNLFSMTFVCEKFDEHDVEDEEEIAEKRWFAFDEVNGLEKSAYAAAVWKAYQEYLETGEFQQVVLHND